jgi:hypothetical protein
MKFIRLCIVFCKPMTRTFHKTEKLGNRVQEVDELRENEPMAYDRDVS